MNLSIAAEPALPEYHVIMKWGSGFGAEIQGRTMLALEKMLRELGMPAEVFKETAADDSRLRRSMTKEQRERL